MRKSTVVKTWLAGVITFAGGLAVAGVFVGLMLGFAGTFTPAASGQGYDFVPREDGFFWGTISGIVFGGVIAGIGGLIQLVAWVGAMINTYRLPEKTWFAVLLIGGVLGFWVGLIGLAAMLAYVIAGPDGLVVQATPAPIGQAKPGALAPTA